MSCRRITTTRSERQGSKNSRWVPAPYTVEEFQRGSFVRLKANADYWGGAPAFETVVFKFVTDPAARIAEIESGRSDMTLNIPFEEFDRLKAKPGLEGVATPVSDIAMIFFNDIAPMTDINVRKAAVMAVDKKAIVNQILRGYGVPIETLLAPPYTGFDPEVMTPYDPEGAAALLAKSGYSREKPVEFKIQTTRGYIAKDYDVIQAIVGMWRRIGIRAEIEVYEIAKHFELRAQDQLAPAAFYNWGNSIGDPSTSTGHAMFGPSPHSTWDTEDLDAMIGPLWVEKDEARRIAGWQEVNRHIAEKALCPSRCISRSSRWCTRRASSSRATSPTSSCPRRCRRLDPSPSVAPLPFRGGAGGSRRTRGRRRGGGTAATGFHRRPSALVEPRPGGGSGKATAP